ncbi:MAG: peptidoglycan-binding protein [Oscillospiraceae bacterium]|nr:peptidoglycan-binding protein [Oscillospiraceae bacterium]
MANYTTLSMGSRGDSVKELQRQLNSNGYTLDVDGIFGNKTLTAVKDYQTKNNLSVDGIVGNQTWGSLAGGAQKTAGSVSAATNTAAPDNTLRGVSDATAGKVTEYEKGYTPSAAVQAAERYLQELQKAKPGAYSSPYEAQLNEMYDAIVGRKDFSYDVGSDPLYRQYREQYMGLGRRAMQDTIGQAAGLTGGYGSSYAQQAGQQAYQTYLQQLNDRVPELYREALARYEAEGEVQRQNYAMLADRENTAYGRHRDEVGDYRDDLATAYQQFQNERNFDYGQYGDMLDYYRQKAAQENSDYWTQTQYDYQKERDAVADEQWAKQYALSAAKSTGVSSKKDGDTAADTYENEKITVEGLGSYTVTKLLELVKQGKVYYDPNDGKYKNKQGGGGR